jgi:FAD synthase
LFGFSPFYFSLFPLQAPKPTDRIVYIAGGWDMFHAGHMEALEKAKKSVARIVLLLLLNSFPFLSFCLVSV